MEKDKGIHVHVNPHQNIQNSKDFKSPSKIVIQHGANHIVHPVSSGPVNCLLAVDHVVRATTDYGSPKKIQLSPSSSFHNREYNPLDEEEEGNILLQPLQDTRHLFVRRFKKPLKWPLKGNKQFQVLNSSGNCIYYGAEKNVDFISKSLWFLRGGISPFNIGIFTPSQEPVLEIQGRVGLFQTSVVVRDAGNELIGRIVRKNSPCSLGYSILSWDGNEILRIIGPDGSNCCCCFQNCCAPCSVNEDFDINLPDGQTSVGKISSVWEYALEDLSGLFVPMKLDEQTMSLLLGMVFLIDFSYYQRRRKASCFGKCFLNIICFGLFMILLYCIAKKQNH